MRSHMKIITDFGATKVANVLIESGLKLATNTPQRWGERNRIPSEWWPHLVAAGVAQLDELAAGVLPRERKSTKQGEAA